jgi:5-methylcytosine-specific restriction enzyme A
MAKLRMHKTAVRTGAGSSTLRVQTREERIARRDGSGWRLWYKTARWQKLRWAVIIRDACICSRCGRVGNPLVRKGGDQRDVLVANHIKPHRGDAALFWDETNLETACLPCHGSVIQKEEYEASTART